MENDGPLGKELEKLSFLGLQALQQVSLNYDF